MDDADGSGLDEQGGKDGSDVDPHAGEDVEDMLTPAQRKFRQKQLNREVRITLKNLTFFCGNGYGNGYTKAFSFSDMGNPLLRELAS